MRWFIPAWVVMVAAGATGCARQSPTGAREAPPQPDAAAGALDAAGNAATLDGAIAADGIALDAVAALDAAASLDGAATRSDAAADVARDAASLALDGAAAPDAVVAAPDAPVMLGEPRGRKREICSEDSAGAGAGWCWRYPLPQGNDLHNVWGTAANNVWAVGERGVILHWNGTDWAGVPSPTTAALYGLHGSGPADVWAVGAGGVTVHFDGQSWREVLLPVPTTGKSLIAVWSLGPTDAWAVGTEGLVVRWNGSGWSAPAIMEFGSPLNRRLMGIWGFAPDDVWVIGEGVLLQWDGRAWKITRAPEAPVGYATSIFARGRNDVWLTDGYSYEGALTHWNGTTWEKVLPYRGHYFTFVTGDGTADGFWTLARATAYGQEGLIARRGPGRAPSDTVFDDNLARIWVAGPDQAWGVGMRGFLYRWNGQRWEPFNGRPTPRTFGLWGYGPGNVWAINSAGHVLHFTDAGWEETARLPPPTSSYDGYADIGGSAPGDQWAVSAGGRIFHGDGRTWAELPAVPKSLTAVWAPDARNAWIVGQNETVLRWDGSVWKQDAGSFYGHYDQVWGTSATDVWIGNYTRGIFRRGSDGTWKSVPAELRPTDEPGTLRGLAGSGLDHIYSTRRDQLWRFDPARNAFTFVVALQPLSFNLFTVGGQVWVPSSDSTPSLLQWDGATKTIHKLGTARQPYEVWAHAPDDVWLAIGHGIMRRRRP